MPKKSVHKLAVKSVGETMFSLHSVTTRPRHSTPMDLQMAVANLQLEPLTKDAPEDAVELVRYLLTDFFVLLHRSGLYNRQMALWEAIAVVSQVQISRQNQGFIAKIELPIWEILMLDSLGRKLLLVRYLDDSQPNLIDANNDKDALRFLQDAIKRAEKLRVENPAFAGLILCCPAPMPEIIINSLLKQTGTDSVARYQSLLPTVGCSIDLIVEEQLQFSLVLPQLADRIKSLSLSASVTNGEEPAPTDEIEV